MTINAPAAVLLVENAGMESRTLQGLGLIKKGIHKKMLVKIV